MDKITLTLRLTVNDATEVLLYLHNMGKIPDWQYNKKMAKLLPELFNKKNKKIEK